MPDLQAFTRQPEPREPFWVPIVRPFAVVAIWLFVHFVIVPGIRRGLVMGGP